jgi:hypothetical protein
MFHERSVMTAVWAFWTDEGPRPSLLDQHPCFEGGDKPDWDFSLAEI